MWYLIINALAGLLLTVVCLTRYAAKSNKDSIVGYAVGLAGWNCAWTALYLLPNDTALQLHIVRQLWTVVYWIGFVLTWIIIPILQSYYESGYLTFFSRFKHALRANLIFYGIPALLLIGFIIIEVISGHLNLNHVFGFIIALSNTWGLVFFVLFLGYGLVDIPRGLWKRSDFSHQKKKLYCQISNDHSEFHGVLCDLAQLYVEASHICHRAEISLSKNPVLLTRYAHSMIQLFPTDEKDFRRLADLDDFHLSESDMRQLNNLSEKELAKKRQCVLKHVARYHALKHRFDCAIDEIAIMKPHATHRRQVIQKFLWRSAAIICGVMSGLVLFSECTLMVPFKISPIGLSGNFANHTSISRAWNYVWVFYIALCSLGSFFRLRLWWYYRMEKGHSNVTSILFNASYLIRLETGLENLFGPMQYIPFLGVTINIYFPLVLLLICFLNGFNAYGKMLRILRLTEYYSSATDVSERQLSSGKAIANRELRRRGREYRDAVFDIDDDLDDAYEPLVIS